MKRKGFLQTAFMLTAALLLLAACTQDELSDKQGETLPEGKCPLTFTAAIDGEAVAATPQTRASVDGTFGDVDYIGAQIPVDNSGKDTRRFVIFKKNGADDTTWEYDRNISGDGGEVYWKFTGNAYPVKAWYFNQNQAGEYYKTQYEIVPGYNFSWTVTEDQREDGYANSDFLYAFDYIYFYNGNKALHFFHQTAKVVVHIIKGDQTPADITGVKSMTIGDENSKVYVCGSWNAPGNSWRDNESKILGDWNTFGTTQGFIHPKALGQQEITVDGKKVQPLASYEALVIPQATATYPEPSIHTGKTLFAINIDGYAPFYYKLPDGGITWTSGTEYTYYITIKGSSLSVTTSESIGWDSGNVGSGSVTLPIGNKTAEEAEIGDFYMSDGSLVGKGATLIQKAACIGIVFQTDPNRIGKAEKDAGYTHGLVMAMKNAASNVTWGPYDTDTGLKNCESWDDCKNDISGLSNCQTIKALNNWNNYPAFKAADDYNTTCKAPTNTTGWYLPASGQLYDMFVNLGKLSTAQPANNNNVYYWSGQAQTVVNNLNNHMTSVTSKDDFEASGFWSSSESDSNYAWHWHLFTDDYVTCMRSHKSTNDRVRAVLAF